MNIPAMSGIIRRRILLNYRVSPEIVARQLPANFRPKLAHGHAIAGICLIRLEQVRPKGLPAIVGVSSENSAHRIAVEWSDESGQTREGVFVPRRDTDSLINHLGGGRIFPGVHQYSDFHVTDHGGKVSIRVQPSGEAGPLVELDGEECAALPETSVFRSLAESSAFFESGCIGYSSRPDSCVMDGLLLKVPEWKVTPLGIRSVRSAYFDDRTIFPEGTIAFDHALVMRDILHEWHSEPMMMAEAVPAT